MALLSGEDTVERKAFELAVRDPAYRKTRMEELRRKTRTSFWLSMSGMAVGTFFVISFYNKPATITYFLASFAVTVQVLGPLIHISGFRSEIRMLLMMDVQDGMTQSWGKQQ